MVEPIPGGGQEARPLAPELAGVLQDLAQALLNLEHALCFYPEGHQSRQAPLERLVAMMQAEAAIAGEGSLAFAGELLRWRGVLANELPAAARKLSTLLGNQGIARLSWSPGLTAVELERFLALLARGRSGGRRETWDQAVRFENLRVEGLDYQALMVPGVEEKEGLSAERRNLWQALLPRLLVGQEFEPTAGEMQLLRDGWEDPAALASLLGEAIGPGAQAGAPGAVEPLRRFAGLLEHAAAAGEPLPAGECARKLGAVARQLPAALRLRLLEAAMKPPTDGIFAEAFGALDVDEGIELIAETFSMDSDQIERLAHVFQHLIPRQLERMELAPQLREGIRRAEDPDDPLADNVWGEVQELLTGESGEFMSAGYQEQLRRLAAREDARRGGEKSLAELPDLVVNLTSEQVSGESLLIQFEQLRLATSVERYRDALEGVGGLCSVSLAAGDRERGLLILRRLLEEYADEAPLAGPRTEIERALRSIAAPSVLQALIQSLGSLGPEDQAAVRTYFSLVHVVAAPALLAALVAEEDTAQRRQIAMLLQSLGPAVFPEVLRRLAEAPPAAARALLPLVSETSDPAAAPVLLGLLGRDDPKLRRDALRTLIRIDSPEVRRALPRLLDDRDDEIVQLAAAHLGAVGSPETVRELLRLFDGRLFSGRRAEEMKRALFVLGRMRAAEAVGPLSILLRRRAWINRRAQEQLSEAAAQALARIGGDEAKKALEQVAARGSEGLAATCRRLLARWGSS
ncbi:MAG: HEAT repeat domain-containing protein [Candidatus Methylomirabilia bacterium]